jgi:putative DNA primase/helicase
MKLTKRAHGLFFMSIASVSSLPPLPSIADIYLLLRGATLEGNGAERRGFCLSVSHNDNDPSCDYNVVKNTFHCKSCEKQGGALDLPVVAAKAADRKASLRYLKDKGLVEPSTESNVWASANTIYSYQDAAGVVVYEVGRWNLSGGGKQFRQRVPDGRGGYNTKAHCLDGVARVPYRLPELAAHISTKPDVPVYVVEGEKDANNLGASGATVTTNAQGAAWAWPVAWATLFQGLSVVYVLADNDEPGHKAAIQRAKLIRTVVPDVRVVRALPGVGEKGDVSDWLAQNDHDLDALAAICAAGEGVMAYMPAYDAAAVPAIVEDRSDMGAARWFNHHFRDVTLFVGEAKSWYAYGDGTWGRSPNAVGSRAQDAMDGLRDAANDYSGQGGGEFQKFAEACRSQTRRDAMLRTAADKNLANIASFDAHPTLLNCANGTVDLKTGEMYEHHAEDMLTMKSSVVYERGADCPTFRAWLMGCVRNDKDLFDYMQQVMGSCLEGRPGLRSFYFIFGPKGTGKSTFIRVLEALLGPYQAATDFSSLTEGRFGANPGSASPHLAMLKGKRMVSAAEARGTKQLDAARIKQLIGGDIITARFLHQDLFEFRFEATLIMSGNDMPRIVGDDSIWDKFKPFPFLHEIEAEDPDFEERELLPELSGILNFAIEGLRRLRASRYRLAEPKAVTDARSAEFAEQDTFKTFVEECLVKLDTSKRNKSLAAADLRDAYARWSTKANAPRLHPKALKQAMERHGFEYTMSQNLTVWKNVALRITDSMFKTSF